MILPDCMLQNKGEISTAFIAKGVTTFANACAYVKSLPYGRNINKEDVFCVFNDNHGTCSTKHAMLKRLADENDLEQVLLVTGIYKMNHFNTPGIGKVLEDNKLEYIPEAHNYLKVGNTIFDFTFTGTKTPEFALEIMEETLILPYQINEDKIKLHKSFLAQWLLANKNINLSLSRLWEIREECIANLSQNKK